MTKDNYKNKEQLVDELKTLYERLAQLEKGVSEYQHTEHIIRQREHFLKDILDSIQNGISILDKDLHIIFVNKSMENWYAHHMPLVGKKCYDAYHGRAEPCKVCPSLRTLKSGKQEKDIVPLSGPEGITGWLELFTFPLRDSDSGQLIGIVEYVHDITEQKNAEEKILQAKEEWQNTFDTVRDLIFITSKEGIIRRVNVALADKLGMHPRELIGKACWDIFRCGREKTDQCSLNKIQRGVKVREHETEISSLGMWVIAHVFAVYTPSQELDYIIHTYRDITDHKQLEKQLLQLTQTEAVARLAGGIAHEFNNLLTGIIGNLSLAQSQLRTDSEEYVFLERAYQSAERSAELVKRLLAFASRLHVTYNLLSANNEIMNVVSLLRDTTDQRINIDVHADNTVWSVMADPVQIRSMLTSLLLNARDALTECLDGLFRYECEERDSFTITIKAENIAVREEDCAVHPDARPGEFVLITIADDGPGMDEETLRHVFEPFFSTRDMDRGKGLGLATVYGIVKQYKGWVYISSKRGRGTTVNVYLPRAEST
jgi:PAS domain S-box-containing protein